MWTPLSFPEVAILLVSDGDRHLWPTSGQVQHRKSANHGFPVTLRMPRVTSDKSDWFWSQSIVFTKPFKTGMSLDLAGVPISSAWRKGPLGTSCGNTNSQASVSAAFSSVSVTRKKHKRRVPISFRNYYDEKQIKQLVNFDHQNVKCKFSSLVQSLREQLVKPVSAPFFWVIF